jgi:prostaglandin-endoperoxide synthase 2
MGTDTRNIGFVSFNVLFLREHNRIATALGREHPSWSSDEIFEKARNTVIVVLLKIVVEEHINHINPYKFKFRLIPGSFPNERWHRPNWMAIEFNLLYRWHSLVPSTFHLRGTALPIAALLSNTKVLTDVGLGELLAAASSQAAGRICLHNTHKDLVPMAEKPSIEQARVARLASYNDYRRLCRFPPAASFAEISSNTEIQEQLAALYETVEDVEFYVGLFAEDLQPGDVLPPLMLTMVAFDAFSQALTNPLLGPRVFDEATFSATGMEIIKTTQSIEQIVNRNVPQKAVPYRVSFRRSEDARR